MHIHTMHLNSQIIIYQINERMLRYMSILTQSRREEDIVLNVT